jgi:hypothetical protein
MSLRLVPLLVGIAGFLVTLMLCGRHEEFDRTSVASPTVAAQPAQWLIPAPVEPVSAEPAAMRAEDSGPTAAPPSTLNEDRAMTPDDSATPSADEREEAERRRDDVRGARAR